MVAGLLLGRGPGGSAAYWGWLQVSRIRWRSSSLSL